MSEGGARAVGVGAAMVLVLAVVAAFVIRAGLTGTGPGAADGAVLDWFLAHRSAGWTAVAVVVTNVGSTLAMAAVAVVVGIALWLRGRRADAVFLVGVMAVASAVFRLLKMSFDRPRPPAIDRLVNETNESMPSGHATMSVAVIGALVAVFWAGRTVVARVAMVAAAALWVLAVGVTRMYLGVHWFSDVLAGWFVGAAVLAVACTLRARWRHRATPHPAATAADAS
ncbi:phosphatase PAP2 family protein [Pseudonocardia acidicola]|uniref:Phosphatase PAP2 family protein n=1 Tax=Pseudonocardia acidicola TaxID=2724939 RepID=A0ABX1SGY1_9PSEU|nr:phosphatase PAP2 family protein [Pseudonocardia acidicola]NMI00824.1 phosphatase PAP2 family protein [Pseudonocardia acidicola]